MDNSSSLSTQRMEGNSKKWVVASALVLLFASVAVFQFSLTNELSISDVIGAMTGGEARRLQLMSFSAGQGFGGFYATIYVGEPPQAQRLQVVTSIDYTTMICPDCFHCGSFHFDPPFDPVASKTAVYAQCGSCLDPQARCLQTTNECLLTSNFLGTLAAAVEVKDAVVIDYKSTTVSVVTPATLDKKTAFQLNFQCVNFLDSQSALTNMVADGYLSLSTAKTSFLQQMFDAGKISKRVFSMCFRDNQHRQPDGGSAGTLSLGEIRNPNQFKTPLVYARNSATQVDGTPSGYSVNVRRVFLAIGSHSDALKRISQSALSLLPIESAVGQSMDVYTHVSGGSGNVEVDISKPYTLLHRSLMRPFTSAFYNVTGLRYDRSGIPMTLAQYKQLPTIVLQLEASDLDLMGGYVLVGVPGLIGEFDQVHPMDILVAIPPQHYLVYNPNVKIATPTVIFDTTVSFLGSNVFQGHEVVFDLDQSRIGFAEQDCSEGLSLVTYEMGAQSAKPSSHDDHNETWDGNNTVLDSAWFSSNSGSNLTTSTYVPGAGIGVSVSSDQSDATTTTSTGTTGARSNPTTGREFTDSGASTLAQSQVSSSEVGTQVMSSISSSKTTTGTGVVVTEAPVASSSSSEHVGLPKPITTDKQSMRYGPAVTTPYSFAAAQTASGSSTVNSSTKENAHGKTGGSELLWILMAVTAVLLGFGLTVVGTRAEYAHLAGPRWGRGNGRTDDGLSVFDANTTVYGGGGRKHVYDGTGRSLAGSRHERHYSKKQAYNEAPPRSSAKQVYEPPKTTKQVYEPLKTNTKQVYEGPKSTTTKQVYEGPKSTKQVYEGAKSTKQVYEGPTNTKQVYEGPGSDHTKSLSTSTGKDSNHSIFGKGLFGGGKKQKEVRNNDGGTVATGWSQNSGSLFSPANRSKAQSQGFAASISKKAEPADTTKSSKKSFYSSIARKGKDAKDDTTAFTYGSQSHFGHNID